MKRGNGLPEDVRQTFLEKDNWPCLEVKINSVCPLQPYQAQLAYVLQKKHPNKQKTPRQHPASFKSNLFIMTSQPLSLIR